MILTTNTSIVDLLINNKSIIEKLEVQYHKNIINCTSKLWSLK